MNTKYLATPHLGTQGELYFYKSIELFGTWDEDFNREGARVSGSGNPVAFLKWPLYMKLGIRMISVVFGGPECSVWRLKV
jgi:hypothetical protein